MNKVVSVTEFDKAMVGDDRSTAKNVATIIQNFDPMTRKHRLTPYRNVEDADGASATNKITDFINYSGGLATNLYGLGQASSNVQVFVRDNPMMTGSHWSTFSASTGASGGVPSQGVFIQYKGSAYGTHSDGTIWRCQLNGGGFTDSVKALGGAPTCALVHSKNGILYMAYSNIVATYDGSSWVDSVLSTIPSKYTISCLAEFNDYLAIGCNGNDGHAVVYLWDKKTTIDQTTNFCLDWGYGTLQTLQQLEEYLIGVSVVVSSAGVNNLHPKMTFRRFVSGAGGVVFNELIASSASGLQVNTSSQKVNNRMYFAGGITIDGTLYNGIWAIERPKNGSEFSVWIDRLPNNDTAIVASALATGGFILLSDYVFISYEDSGFKMRFTRDAATFTATSIYETTINPNMDLVDKTKMKQVKVLAASCVPLPSGGSLIVKYKVDGGSYTTVLTQTTIGAVTLEMPSSGVTDGITNGREYKFRIESTGLAEPTELKYAYEVIDTLM